LQVDLSRVGRELACSSIVGKRYFELCRDIVCGKHNRLSRFTRGCFGVAHRAVAPPRRPEGGCAAV
jgi:hypothetical protein